MSGKYKSFSGNTLVLSHDGSPDTSHSVDPAANVTLNGKKCKMTDLQVGDNVELSGDPATAIKATR